MSDVVSLAAFVDAKEANQPHVTGRAQCRVSPDHVWQAVIAADANLWLLECPRCREMTGHIPAAQPETPHEARVWAEGIFNYWHARATRETVP